MASTGLLIAGLGSLVGGGVAGGLQYAGESNAANTELQVAQMENQTEQQQLGFEQGIWNTEQAEEAPYLQAGTSALGALESGLGLSPSAVAPDVVNAINSAPQQSTTQVLPAGQTAGVTASGTPAVQLTGGPNPQSPLNSLASTGTSINQAAPGSVAAAQTAPQLPANTASPVAAGTPLNTTGALNANSLNEQWDTQFQAPTASQAAATPGEQFEMQSGENALQNSAAAQGNLLSSSTLKGLQSYGENLASTYYQQAYNNALQQYQQNYNIFENNQSNEYNRLASMAGYGQTAAGQLNSAAGTTEGATASTALTGAAQQANALTNAAAATASGYTGLGNSISSGANSLGSLAIIQQLLNQGGASSSSGSV